MSSECVLEPACDVSAAPAGEERTHSVLSMTLAGSGKPGHQERLERRVVIVTGPGLSHFLFSDHGFGPRPDEPEFAPSPLSPRHSLPIISPKGDRLKRVQNLQLFFKLSTSFRDLQYFSSLFTMIWGNFQDKMVDF